jgi:hypothetical protein
VNLPGKLDRHSGNEASNSGSLSALTVRVKVGAAGAARSCFNYLTPRCSWSNKGRNVGEKSNDNMQEPEMEGVGR